MLEIIIFEWVWERFGFGFCFNFPVSNMIAPYNKYEWNKQQQKNAVNIRASMLSRQNGLKTEDTTVVYTQINNWNWSK